LCIGLTMSLDAMAMLRKRFIKGIPVCGDTRAMLHS
jgi:hypothetical protein